MAPNMPITNNPIPICRGVSANAVSMADPPIPKKNTSIIPLRLHLSANQPAGTAKTPKATNPGVA